MANGAPRGMLKSVDDRVERLEKTNVPAALALLLYAWVLVFFSWLRRKLDHDLLGR